MITDGRTQGLHTAGFPVGCASPDARGPAVPSPAPATSTRACGSPAHGLPTPFTAVIRFLPPGLSRPGRDHSPMQTQQPAPIHRLVAQDGPAEAASAFVPLTDEHC